MAMRSKDEGRVSRMGVTARAARSPRWAMANRAIGAVQRTRRITYRFTGSPATRITGESAMIMGHVASEMAAWAAGPGCLIEPG